MNKPYCIFLNRLLRSLFLIVWLLFPLPEGEASGQAAFFFNNLFGTVDSSSSKRLQPLWDAVESMIDSYDPRELQRRNPDLQWFKTDRSFDRWLLFHWGFTLKANPSTIGNYSVGMALKNKIRKDMNDWLREMERQKKPTKEKGDFGHKAEQNLFKEIEEMRLQRETKLKDTVFRTMDPGSYKRAGELALMLYNAYLLNKFIASSEQLRDRYIIDSIIKEIKREGLEPVVRGSGLERQMQQEILTRCEEAIRQGSGVTPRNKIETFLEALQYAMPRIIRQK